MNIDLNPDGPHSGSYSQEVAEAIAEGFRVLGHATIGTAPGLDHASDVDRIVHELQSAAYRLPQVLHQVGTWLQALHEAGRLADDRGGEAATALADVLGQFSTAINAASRLSGALREAGHATSHMITLDVTDDHA